MCSKAIAIISNRTFIRIYYDCNFIGNLHNNCSILRSNIAEITPSNNNLILTMVIIIHCMSTVNSLGQPRS